MPESVIQRMIGDRQFVTRAETEDFLRDVAQTWEREREQRLWQRDYSSIPAYLASVEPNRKRWQEAVGDPSTLQLPEPAGEVEWEPFLEDDETQARWISVPVSGGLRARAILALPSSNAWKSGAATCTTTDPTGLTCAATSTTSAPPSG